MTDSFVSVAHGQSRTFEIENPLEKWRWDLRAWIRRSPAIYLTLVQFSTRHSDGTRRIFGPETELVIDCFPRSGNSFAVHAFRESQSRPVMIAHHFHAPAIIVAGTGRGLPVLTIIRQPIDAVISWLIYRKSRTIDRALDEYIEYYQTVDRCRDKLALAKFESVTADFGKVITALNRRFHTSYEPFCHSDENVQQVFKKIESVATRRAINQSSNPSATANWAQIPIPTDERNAQKESLRKMLAEWRPSDRMRTAEALFRDLVSNADV